MNPFEYFQQMRSQIESDEIVMRNLREYAFGNAISLPYLKKGTTNTHYRIGRVGSMWLATREAMHFKGQPELQIQLCESYLEALVATQNEGKRVPAIAGGVKSVNKGGKERFFLLLEDLTQGGSAIFAPGSEGEVSGFVNGEQVFYDFHETQNETDLFIYMAEDKLIQLIG